jgi:hypothetical protein
MKKTMIGILIGSTSALAAPREWNFTGGKTFTAWMTFGAVRPSSAGLVCGPSLGSYAVSGIRSGPFSLGADNAAKVSVKLGDIKVVRPAPDEIENGNDIYIHIAINGSRDLIWESYSAVASVQLFYNSSNQGLWVELRGKGEGRAFSVPQALMSGAFLGEGSGDGDISIQLELTREKIIAIVTPANGLAQTFEAPLPEELQPLTRQSFFVQIYQQNVDAFGTGSIAIRSVSVF